MSARCFGDGDPLYERYHDEEWGRPVRDERGLFERISLEAFQSGLSWLTILRKRDAFRAAFANFDPDAVAGFGDADVARLLDRILRVGTVDFDTAGTDDSDFTFRGIANPDEVVSAVDRAQRVAAEAEDRL